MQHILPLFTRDYFFKDILDFIKQAQERVLQHQEEQALLKAYIAEWRKFFTQCGYLPMPFGQLETALQVRKKNKFKPLNRFK